MRFSSSAVALVSALGLCLPAIHQVAAADGFFYDMQSEWPNVNPPQGTNNECGREGSSGLGQSPIDITTESCPAVASAAYEFYAGDCTIGDYKFSTNDHGVKADLVGACQKPVMIVPGTDKEYEVLQFHIHTGCEHNFDGQGCDAELHIVHVAKGGVSDSPLPDLAVVGIMLHGTDTWQDSFDRLLDGWSAVSCADDCDAALAQENTGTHFTPYSLLPSGTNFYNYQGSLTTPPCWEVVTWNVAESPMMVSWRQILDLSNLINNFAGSRNDAGACEQGETVASAAGLTGRDTQPILGRQITKMCTPYIYEREQE